METKDIPHVTVIIDGMERRVPAHLVNSKAFRIQNARVVPDRPQPQRIAPVLHESAVTDVAPEIEATDEITEAPARRGRKPKTEA